MAATHNPVDIAAIGKILPTLDDVRLLLYVLIVALVLFAGLFMYLLRWVAARFAAMEEGRANERLSIEAARENERADIERKEARIWAVADKFTEAGNKLAVELQLRRAMTARQEARSDGVPGQE